MYGRSRIILDAKDNFGVSRWPEIGRIGKKKGQAIWGLHKGNLNQIIV